MRDYTMNAGTRLAAIGLGMLLGTTTAGADGLLSGEQMLQRVAPEVQNVNTAELRQILERRPDTVLIDVRSPGEIHLRGGMIDAPRSYNIARGWLEFRVIDTVPDRDTPIVVYCGINLRSPLAAQTLQQMGYSDVRNYSDGFFAWRDAGLPVDAPDLAIDSMLYSRPLQVSDGVWSAIVACLHDELPH